jgi:hypothetical protein
MAGLLDGVVLNCATTGTGTLTLGAPVAPYLSMSGAGGVSGNTYSYSIIDATGGNSEFGRGVWTSGANTLTRGPLVSTNGNAAINCSGAQLVRISALAEDINGGYNLGAWTPYTATLTPNTGTITQGGTSSSLQIGKIVFLSLQVGISSTTGSPTVVTIAFPVAPRNACQIVGRETGNTGNVISVRCPAGATTSQVLKKYDNTAWVPAASDVYEFTAVYEAQ